MPAALAACAAILAAAVLFTAPLLACPSGCAVDLARWLALDARTVELSSSDVRLNTWILAWVQHALRTAPAHLFDANIFHPSAHMLAGSEHMLAVAVLVTPLRLVTTDAVRIYNAALLLSFVIAGLCTFALVRWTTGHTLLAALAGVIAMFMPWRLAELPHLQLLFAGWLPLLWLLTARCLAGEATRLRLAALFVVSAIVFFSSYYLAYFSLFTSTAFLLAAAAAARAPGRRFEVTAVAVLSPALLLVVFSIPYLERRAGQEIVEATNVLRSTPPALLWRTLAPTYWLASPTLPWTAAYSLPGIVTVAAVLAFLPWSMRERSRIVIAGLLAAAAVALVMSFGDRLQVGGSSIPLPASAAEALIPGFGILRAPLRWTLVLGVVWPVLAGIGLAKLHASLRARAGGRAAIVAASLLGSAAVAAMIPPALPTISAFPNDAPAKLAAYAALAKLPAGPVLELPWPELPITNASSSSEYMVASTRHWRPLLNGYTGYEPRSYDFLVRAGARLPERGALDRMSKLTAVRWLVAHLDRMDDSQRRLWENAPMSAPLVSAYRDDQTIIYEVPGGPDAGALLARVRGETAFADTLSGASRSPLELSVDDGTLSAVFPLSLGRYRDGWASRSVPLRIANHTSVTWPGIDPDPTGLVHVRFRMSDTHGNVSVEAMHELDDDVAAGATLVENVLVEGRLEEGEYRLCLDLVQIIDGQPRTLAIAPACGQAKVAAVHEDTAS